MEKIKIDPNGINLSCLINLGENLICAAMSIADCYKNESFTHSKICAAKDVEKVNYLLSQLNLPEIEINLDFIEKVRKEREQ